MTKDLFGSRTRKHPQGRTASAGSLASLLFALLLVLSVQGASLETLLSHWASADHCGSAADCQPLGAKQDADGCDSPCSCLGCPAHVGALALLNQLIDLGLPVEFRAGHTPDDSLSDLLLQRSVFRPPCA